MEYVISSGQTSTFDLKFDDSLQVQSGGTSLSSHIGASAEVVVSAGGLADADIVGAKGTEDIESGGLAEHVRVLAGGVLILDGAAQDVTVSSGGQLDVMLMLSTGMSFTAPRPREAVTISGVSIQSGGVLQVDGGVVSSGAVLDVGSGASIGGGSLLIERGGVLSGTGMLDYFVPGFSTQDYGLIEDVTFSGTFLEPDAAPADVYIQSGGMLESGTLKAGYIYVEKGAKAYETTLDSGGSVLIAAGGQVSGSTILDYGAEVDEGTATSTTVESGGQEMVERKGLSVDAQVTDGGVLLVEATGRVEGSMIRSGGVISLGQGGSATKVEVEHGGTLELGAVHNGEHLLLTRAGESSATTMSGVTVERGGFIKADGAVVSRGGIVEIALGAVLSDATVKSGGEIGGPGEVGSLRLMRGSVLSGIALTGATRGVAELEGDMQVGSGARLASGVLESGATVKVLSGGVVADSTLQSGSTAVILAGARLEADLFASGATIVDDGTLYGSQAPKGGIFDGNVEGHGQIQVLEDKALVLAGNLSSFSGTIVDVGRIVEVAGAGGLGAATFLYDNSAGATLQLDLSSEPANGALAKVKLSNFDTGTEALDLRGVLYGSGATATVVSSVLTLQDGGYSAKFKLTGSVASAYSVISDKHGGTEITIAGGGAAALVQAATGFGSVEASPAPTAFSVQSAGRPSGAETLAGDVRHALA